MKSLKKIYRRVKAKFFNQSNDKKIKIRNSDIYLVSYPKSGNTWMRFLLINYFFNKKKRKLKYDDLEIYIPSIHRSSPKEINNLKGLRIVKSHYVKKEYPKVIYIVRDGRDAMVSYYYFLRDLKGFKGDFTDFYNSDHGGNAGTWDEHLRNAINYRKLHPENIVIVKYEDLKKNPHKAFGTVVEFLGKNIKNEDLEFAITNSAFDNLKSMQESNGVNIDNKEINFFRKGQSGQWTNYFTEELNSDFIKKSGDLMNMFGYSIDE